MGSLIHVKSNTIGDFTGTVTVPNSAGGTETKAATDLVRPSDWNSAHQFNQTISGNTGGDASTASGTNLVIGGTNGASVALSTAAGAATLWVDAGAGGAAQLSYWNPQDAYMQVGGQQGNGTFHVQPAQAPSVTFDRIAMPLLFSGATNSTGTMSGTVLFGVYTRNVGTLSLLASTSTTFTVNHSGTASSTVNNGIRLMTIPFSSSLAQSQYWIGIGSRSSTAGANVTWSQQLASQVNSNFSGLWGVGTSASIQYTRGLGHYSATTTAVPSSIAYSQINGTASIVLRQPVFYLVNGTV